MSKYSTKTKLKKKEIELLDQQIKDTENSNSISNDKKTSLLNEMQGKKIKLQRQLVELEAEDEKQAALQKHKDCQHELPKLAKQFIKDNSLYYLEHAHGTWIISDGISTYDAIAISNRENWWPDKFSKDNDPKQDFFRAVQNQLAGMGRTYHSVTQSFSAQSGKSLNLLRNAKAAFVQPIVANEPIHPLIEALFVSLGAHKPENVKHLQEVVFHKWQSPENHNLPSLVISGEGAIGKNIFADMFLSTLFGGKHSTATISDLGANFNDELEGKAVVLVDEGSQKFGKAKSNAIKSVIGNPYLNINKKFGPKYTAANTALYIITSNEHAGVWLGNDSSDRRYSILYAEKNKQNTLFDVIAKDILSLSYDGEISQRGNEQFFAAAQSYWNQNKFALEDPTEIGKWLHCYSKVASKHPPAALHGEDYHRLSEKQRPDIERFFQNVLLSPNFNVIAKSELWRWWQEHMHGQGEGKLKYFNNDLDDFIECHPEVSMKMHNVIPRRGASRSRVWIIFNSGKYDEHCIPKIEFDDYQYANLDFKNPEDFAVEQDNVVPIAADQHSGAGTKEILARLR